MAHRRLGDVADYMIGGENGDGYATDVTSGSELDTDNEVEVLEPAKRKITSWQARGSGSNAAEAADGDDGQGGVDVEVEDESVERRAVKLVELGPRMRLRLTKVEDGLCSGRVMWHEYIEKTAGQIKELDKRWEKRRQEKEARRREQKANVEKKRLDKEAQRGGKKAAGDEMDVDDDEEEEDEDQDEEDLENEYFSASDFDEVEAAGGGAGGDGAKSNR